MNEYFLEPSYDSAKSFYKKAYVVENGTKHTLFSYNTKVCEIDFSAEIKVNILGFYSQTTTRHIRDFLYQNGFDIGSRKFLYETYTERGRKELEEKIKRKEERAKHAEEKRILAEEKRLNRIEIRKEKLRKSIRLDIGDKYSEEELETLVLQELNS